MKSYKLIHELISLVEELEQQNPDRAVTMQDFAGFVVHTAGKVCARRCASCLDCPPCWLVFPTTTSAKVRSFVDINEHENRYGYQI